MDLPKKMSKSEKYNPSAMTEYMKKIFSVYYYDPNKLEEQTIDFTQDSATGFWKVSDTMFRN